MFVSYNLYVLSLSTFDFFRKHWLSGAHNSARMRSSIGLLPPYSCLLLLYEWLRRGLVTIYICVCKKRSGSCRADSTVLSMRHTLAQLRIYKSGGRADSTLLSMRHSIDNIRGHRDNYKSGGQRSVQSSSPVHRLQTAIIIARMLGPLADHWIKYL